MDGVTDATFRYITAKYGRPALTMTEFTSVEGIRAGAERLLEDFRYDELERPVVAQLFGADPTAFFPAAVIVSALGFDGIDINMGCPAKNVTEKGAGAALILDPERAREIIRQTRAGTEAWANGLELGELGLPNHLIEKVRERMPAQQPRQALPVSVKTRLGYNEVTITDWVKELLLEKPAAITIHGRTLKQLYTGEADWEAIGQAATIIKQTETLVLGNGDLNSVTEAKARIAQYGLDGALIGRAASGNPWLFQEQIVDPTTRLRVALEHAQHLATWLPPKAFVKVRKPLLDYTKGLENARELRVALMRVQNPEEVTAVLEPLITTK